MKKLIIFILVFGSQLFAKQFVIEVAPELSVYINGKEHKNVDIVYEFDDGFPMEGKTPDIQKAKYMRLRDKKTKKLKGTKWIGKKPKIEYKSDKSKKIKSK